MSKTIIALDFSSKEEVVNFLKKFDDTFAGFFFVEIMIGDHPGMDIEMT